MPYRLLPADEWDKLKPIFEREWPDVQMVTPLEAAFVVYEESGVIMACISLQFLPIIESRWISPQLRGSLSGASTLLNMLSLLSTTFSSISTVYVKEEGTPSVEDKKMNRLFNLTSTGSLWKGERNAWRNDEFIRRADKALHTSTDNRGG